MKNKPTHSPIGASSMYRWESCPGSVALSKGIEHEPSEWAKEGTLAHELAAARLSRQPDPFIPDEEMSEAVDFYVDTVMNDIFTEGLAVTKLVEHGFDLSEIYEGLWGTADCVVYFEKKKLLRVYDYKHGKGLSVEVEANSQLLYYGLGALLTCGFAPEKIELVIVQPRCDHPTGFVRRWEFDSFELLEFAGRLKEAAIKTEDPNAPLVSGDHCRFCPASGICPQIKKEANEVASISFGELVPQKYDPAKLSEVLTKVDLLEDWVKSVRAFAYNELKAGKEIPGFKLVPKRAIRRWINEKEAEDVLESMDLGEVEILNMNLKSPAQIEKLIGKKAYAMIAADFVESVSSGDKMVPETDPTPATKVLTTDDFDVVT